MERLITEMPRTAKPEKISPNEPKVRSWWFFPTCRDSVRLASEAREHQLPLDVRLGLAVHRLFCRWCARYARQIDFLGHATHELPQHLDQTRGPLLASNARDRLKQALREKTATPDRFPE